MLFNSYIFILVFLPLTLCFYYTLNRLKHYRMALGSLIVMSLWFYGYFNLNYLLIIVVSIIINFGFSKKMIRLPESRKKKIILVGVLVFNIGLLFYYKYYDFFISNVNQVFSLSFHMKYIMLPLGISFFTFQQISYAIDCYRENIQGGGYNFLDYTAYVTFFPQLIAGPIVLHNELIPQFYDENKKHINYDNFARGVLAFTLGMAKKVIIADTFGKTVVYGFENLEILGTTNLIIVMLSYTFQIYFDFSGYCDMATGIGLMFNLELPINFNAPYQSFSILEFWKRWHMTLTRFLTQYLYIPLGGSKKGKIRTYIHVLIVFFISGLWHGASWTFVIWGMAHGVASVLNRIWKDQWSKLHQAFQWMFTFLFINVTWVFFRATSVEQGILFIKKLAVLNFDPIDPVISNNFALSEFVLAFRSLNLLDIIWNIPSFWLVLFMAFSFTAVLNGNSNNIIQQFTPSVKNGIAVAIVFLWAFFSLSGVQTFLYFNF